MYKKPSSVFSRIKVTSPIIEALKNDLSKERKAFIESLTTDQLANLFPPSTTLGTLSSGKPISNDDVASIDSSVPIAQTQNGSKVMTDPKTGNLVIVAGNPDDVKIQNPDDVAKLQQLAILAKQSGIQKSNEPSQQQTTAAQTTAQQKSAQQQQSVKVNEKHDTMAEFIDSLNQLFAADSTLPEVNEKPKKDVELTEEDDETSDSGHSLGFDEGPNAGLMSEEDDEIEINPIANDGLVQVNHANDNMIDPNAALAALGNAFWTPPALDAKQTVVNAQNNIGLVGGSVEEIPLPTTMQRSKPNMSQYVKTGLNAIPGMPGNIIGNDFDDVMGIDSPYAIKLAISIGK